MLRPIPQTIVMDNGSVWHPKAGHYLADDETGRIWSNYLQDWFKPFKNKEGYLRVRLQCEEGEKPFLVHRLIYETFQGPIPQGMTINHKIEGEEGKQMNMLSNLEVMSMGDNNRYGTHNERAAAAKSRQVYQYTKELELVEIHASVNECGRQGFNSGHVSQCCRNCYMREGNNVYKDFIWSYVPL